MRVLKKIYIGVFFLGTLLVSRAIPVDVYGSVLNHHIAQVFGFYSQSFESVKTDIKQDMKKVSVKAEKQTAQVLAAVDSTQKSLWSKMIDVLSEPLVPLFTPQVIIPITEKKTEATVPVKKEEKIVLDPKPKEQVVIKPVAKIPNTNVTQNYYYTISQSQIEKAVQSQVAINKQELNKIQNDLREYVNMVAGRQSDSFSNSLNRANVVTVVTQSSGGSGATANFSETATGLDYAGGVLSITSGYEIPTTSSSTAWTSFYDTPSSRITAGTGLSWSGNTLNAVGGGSGTVGSGTAGQVAFYGANGTSVSGTSTVFFANGNVGIGTSSPSSILHLQSDQNSSTVLTIRNDNAGANADAGIMIRDDEGAILSLGLDVDQTGTKSYLWSVGNDFRIGAGNNMVASFTTDQKFKVLSPYNNYMSIYGGSATSMNLVSDADMLIRAGGDLGSNTYRTIYYDGDTHIFRQAGSPWTEYMRIVSGGNLGIGTSSPSAKLDVWGSLKVGTTSTPTLFVNTTAGQNTGLSITNDVSPTIASAGSSANVNLKLTTKGTGGLFLDTGGTGSINFRPNGTQTMTILSTGNVGIGTTTPASQLYIAGTDIGPSNYLATIENNNTAGSFPTRNGLLINVTGTNGGGQSASRLLNIQQYGTSLFYVNGVGDGVFNGGITSGSITSSGVVSSVRLSVVNNNTTATTSVFKIVSGQTAPVTEWQTSTGAPLASLSAGGNLGLGIVPSTFKLDVSGSSRLGYVNINNSADIIMSTQNADRQFTIQGSTATTGSVAGTYITLGTASSGEQKIVFGTNGGEKMRMDPSGNLGIGTTSPAAKLDVWGNLKVGTNAAGTLFVDAATARVGVGTTTPGAKLTVIGDMRIGFNDANQEILGHITGGLLFANQAAQITSGSGVSVRSNGTYGWSSDTGSPGYNGKDTFLSRPFSSTVGVYQSNGTTLGGFLTGVLSVGTTSTSSTLYVQGNGSNNPFTIASSTGTSMLSVLRNGNVGIGTSTPEVKLEVVNSSAAQLRLGYDSQNAINFDVNNSGTLRITPLNNSIRNLLEVRNGDDAAILVVNSIKQTAISGTVYITSDSGTEYGTRIGNVNDGGISFGVNPTNFAGEIKADYDGSLSPLALNPTGGNVGIGTTSPSATLDVWGNLNIGTASVPTLLVDSSTGSVVVSTTTQTGTVSIGGDKQYALYTDTAYSNGASSFSSYGGYFKNYLNSGTAGYSYGIYAEGSAGGVDPDGAYGVYGKATGSYARAGVYGLSEGSGSGLYGFSNSSTGRGLTAEQSNASGYALYTLGGKNYIQNNLGIGTTTPGQKLVVVGNAQFTGVTSGTYANDLNLSAGGVLTTAASDIRLKENLVELSPDVLSKLSNIKGYTFNWKADPERRTDIGVIAQEVESIFPEIVFTNATDGFKGVNYSRLSVLLLKGLQEQQMLLGSYTSDISTQAIQTIIDEAKNEIERNPITVIGDRATQGVRTVTDFVAVRVTAVKGYFGEIFTKEITTEKICVTKSNGSKVCVDGDQLENIINNSNTQPSASPTPSPAQTVGTVPTEPASGSETQGETPATENSGASDTIIDTGTGSSADSSSASSDAGSSSGGSSTTGGDSSSSASSGDSSSSGGGDSGGGSVSAE